MKVEVSYKEIWRISWPIILSSLANTVITFTDVAYVGRIGVQAMAASALGGVFYFLLVMAGMAVGIGAQILIARRAGEERHGEIGNILDHCLVILLAFSGLAMLFIYTIMPQLMYWMVGDAEVARQTIVYLQARGWGLACMMVLVSFRSFYTGITITRIITYTTLVMMVVNLLLNDAFVIGRWGIAPMGIAGSGWASAIAETVAAVYALLYALRRSFLKEYNLFQLKRVHFDTVRQILVLSGPIVLQHVFSMGCWFLFFVFIEKLGAAELAVSNVVRGVYMVLMTPVWGFSQSSSSMVSNLIGQGKEQEVIPLVNKIVRLSLFIGSVGVLLGLVFRDALFALTTHDASIIADAVPVFYVICGATVCFSVSMVYLSGVSGTGATVVAMVIEVLSLLVYLVYVWYFTIETNGTLITVWFSEFVYWFLLGLLAFLYLRSLRWLQTAQKLNEEN